MSNLIEHYDYEVNRVAARLLEDKCYETMFTEIKNMTSDEFEQICLAVTIGHRIGAKGFKL